LTRDELGFILEDAPNGIWAASRNEVLKTPMITIASAKCMTSFSRCNVAVIGRVMLLEIVLRWLVVAILVESKPVLEIDLRRFEIFPKLDGYHITGFRVHVHRIHKGRSWKIARNCRDCLSVEHHCIVDLHTWNRMSYPHQNPAMCME
jgi:hypothetical protein